MQERIRERVETAARASMRHDMDAVRTKFMAFFAARVSKSLFRRLNASKTPSERMRAKLVTVLSMETERCGVYGGCWDYMCVVIIRLRYRNGDLYVGEWRTNRKHGSVVEVVVCRTH